MEDTTSSNCLIGFFLDKFKLIKINLERRLDIKRFIKNILESCSLPTEKIDAIKISVTTQNTKYQAADDVYNQAASIFEEYEMHRRNIQRVKQAKTLR